MTQIGSQGLPIRVREPLPAPTIVPPVHVEQEAPQEVTVKR